MTASTFIARILGPVLVIIGISLLVEGGTFTVIAGDFVGNGALIYLSGLIALAVGLAILNVHHIWVWDWRVVITIFGWLALIGGIFRVLATSLVQRTADAVIANPRWLIVGGAGTLLLGGFLTVMGYQDIWNETAAPTKRRTSATKRASTTADAAKRPRRKTTATRTSS